MRLFSEGDSKCTDVLRGTCMAKINVAECENTGGRFISGLCDQPKVRKCCVPLGSQCDSTIPVSLDLNTKFIY